MSSVALNSCCQATQSWPSAQLYRDVNVCLVGTVPGSCQFCAVLTQSLAGPQWAGSTAAVALAVPMPAVLPTGTSTATETVQRQLHHEHAISLTFCRPSGVLGILCTSPTKAVSHILDCHGPRALRTNTPRGAVHRWPARSESSPKTSTRRLPPFDRNKAQSVTTVSADPTACSNTRRSGLSARSGNTFFKMRLHCTDKLLQVLSQRSVLCCHLHVCCCYSTHCRLVNTRSHMPTHVSA